MRTEPFPRTGARRRDSALDPQYPHPLKRPYLISTKPKCSCSTTAGAAATPPFLLLPHSRSWLVVSVLDCWLVWGGCAGRGVRSRKENNVLNLAGLSTMFSISIGDCFVVFDPTPFSHARRTLYRSNHPLALPASLSLSLSLSGQLHARRLD